MQIPILSGIYTDGVADFRTAMPRNLTAVPKSQGISAGYLASDEGIIQRATGQGADRGGIEWRGECYRVSGTKLIKVAADWSMSVLGDVGAGGPVAMDYSFDRLMINSGTDLFYWSGSALTKVTDPDLGNVLDVLWVDGYTMTTDGESLVVTELTDPAAVDPLKYGSSESDPDPVMGMLKLTREVYAINRHTIEVFQNVGGSGFPFARIDGAQVSKGAIGSRAFCEFAGSIAFLGSGRNEAPAVYMLSGASAAPISTREVDTLLEGYTEAQLAEVVLEARVFKKHQMLLVHLPDRTLQYDAAASVALEQPVWTEKTSTVADAGQYLARGAVWCYGRWIVGDPTSNKIGELSRTVDTHWGQMVGWDFSTQCIYNEGRGAVFHELELVALPGRAPTGADPFVWTSYSLDGMKWSQERPRNLGRPGQTERRIWWPHQGIMRNFRIQRFRGAGTGPVAFARLEARLEPLNG
jgi:hypothetical protein